MKEKQRVFIVQSNWLIVGFLSLLMLTGTVFARGSAKPLALPLDAAHQGLTYEAMPSDVGRNLDDPGYFILADALAAAADYLVQFQADFTDDNAGNGFDGSETPEDPDDSGWDWRLNWDTEAHAHSTAASPTNIYGATAQGLYYAYLATSDMSYFIAMRDAADFIVAATPPSPPRSGADLKFLLLFNDLYSSVVTPTTVYADAAKAKYDDRITVYTTATALAEYIRDARAGQGYENGIIAWDIGIWAVVAQMLYDVYGGTYDQDADDIAEVLYQDSFSGTGYFDVVADAGWDPTYTDTNFYWYTLGLTGLIDAFSYSNTHTAEIAGLITRLQDSQYPNGAFSYCYGANEDDEDWQATAYILLTLHDYNAAAYTIEINHGAYWLGATQHTGGGWVYSSGNHYPEIGGENTVALSFAPPAPVVDAGWYAFVIRESADTEPPYIWGNSEYVPDAVEFLTFASGQKAGLGTDLINGATVSQITSLHIDRLDDIPSSGSQYGPYINIWVTDGNGNYAVIANEPSDGEWAGSRWDVPDWDFLKTKRCKVYETVGTSGGDPGTSWVASFIGISGPITFEDAANLIIMPPPVSYIEGGNGVGTGAPDELGTNVARGYNWIFGDTAANYVTGSGEGFVVDNYTATADRPVHNMTQLTDWGTIQLAVTMADPGNEIHVDAGMYPENPVIDKSLTIQGAGPT
ncbi:hypothetical protein KKH18_12905, partial [bacterium]|nr:hypothetical protein [bacterium]